MEKKEKKEREHRKEEKERGKGKEGGRKRSIGSEGDTKKEVEEGGSMREKVCYCLQVTLTLLIPSCNMCMSASVMSAQYGSTDAQNRSGASPFTFVRALSCLPGSLPTLESTKPLVLCLGLLAFSMLSLGTFVRGGWVKLGLLGGTISV